MMILSSIISLIIDILQVVEHLFVDDIVLTQEAARARGSVTNNKKPLTWSGESLRVDAAEQHPWSQTKKELAQLKEATTSVDGDSTPIQIYDAFAALEQSNMKWYNRLSHTLPIKPTWAFVKLTWANTGSCCPCGAHNISAQDSGLYRVMPLQSVVCGAQNLDYIYKCLSNLCSCGSLCSNCSD
jgi:hypothetical protein